MSLATLLGLLVSLSILAGGLFLFAYGTMHGDVLPIILGAMLWGCTAVCVAIHDPYNKDESGETKYFRTKEAVK